MNCRDNEEELYTVNVPRVLIAATGSGSGKTIITCGLLRLFDRMGRHPRALKCGPDYIDPMFHKKVLGIESANIDTFFMDDNTLRQTIGDSDAEVVLIEGVMGIYDGLSVDSIEGSSIDIAGRTSTPVLLVVDAKGSARTIVSVIKGILADDENRLIKGIILNRISHRTYDMVKPLIEAAIIQDGYDARLAGYVPVIKEVSIESRHLGLKLPHEIDDIREQINRVADVLEESLNISVLDDILAKAPALAYRKNRSIRASQGNLRIAVAYDEAFCFYYEDNFKVLREKGVEIQFFSPIHDHCLPEGVSGILLGGGYPQLYLEELSHNTDMLNDIRTKIAGGMPYLAECGGFMYLHRSICNAHGDSYRMLGIIDGDVKYKDKLIRFGYIEINGNGDDGSLASLVDDVRGHEFHYYDSTDNGRSCIARKPGKDTTYECIHSDNRSLAGFPHLYYRTGIRMIEAFIKAMTGYKNLA